MSMFKRVEKRRRKQLEEEELGLDGNLKQVLGLQDTDSEESNTDNGEESGADLSDADDEEDSVDERSPITLQEALQDPIHIVSLQPTTYACVVCPGKLLKTSQIVELHKKSNAHERRAKLFKAQSSGARPNEDAWSLLRKMEAKRRNPALETDESKPSKRAEKRAANTARRRARRKRQKAMAMAENASGVPKPTTDDQQVGPSLSRKKRKAESKTTGLSINSAKREV